MGPADIPSAFVLTKRVCLLEEVGPFPLVIIANKMGVSSQKINFPKPNQVVFVPSFILVTGRIQTQSESYHFQMWSDRSDPIPLRI